MKLFIDTNVYLSFFSLTNDDLEELRKLGALIDAGNLTLLITQQVKDEFNRNRENKIQEALKKLKEQDRKIQFPALCKEYEEYRELRETQRTFKSALDALQTKVREDALKQKLSADSVISELFEKATFLPDSEETVKKAQRRMAVGNPPGKDGSLGDAINWELLLAHGSYWEDLHIVSDDRDFYSVLDEDALHGFLSAEWSDAHDADTYTYRRISKFFSEHFPDIKVAGEVEMQRDVEAFAYSGNFSRTHASVQRLQKYEKFGAAHAEMIANAFINNNQVRWIVTDADVYEFLIAFFNSSSERLKDEVKAELKELLEEAHEYHKDDDDIPF